jgi:hypothetical protein
MKGITGWLSSRVLSDVGQVCGSHCEVMRAGEHSGAVAKLDAGERRSERFSGMSIRVDMWVTKGRMGGKIEVHVGRGACGWGRERKRTLNAQVQLLRLI